MRYFFAARLHKIKQKLLRTERLLELDTTEQNDPQNAVESRVFCGSLAKCAAGHTSNLANKENDSPNAAPILTTAAQSGNVLQPSTLRSSPSSSDGILLASESDWATPVSSTTTTRIVVDNRRIAVDNPLSLRPDICARREEHTTTGSDNDIPSASTSSPEASTSSSEASTSTPVTSTPTSSLDGIRRGRSRSKVFYQPLNPDVFVLKDSEKVTDALVKSWNGKFLFATLQVSSHDQSPSCGPSGGISGQSPIGGPLCGISEEEDVDTTVTKLEKDFDNVAAIMNRINSDPQGFPLSLIRKKFHP